MEMEKVQEPLARPAFGRVLSREMYERLLKEKGPNLDVYLSYAAFHAENGNVVESMEVLLHSCKHFSVPIDKMRQVVSKIVQYLRQEARDNSNPPQRNVFSCPSCWGVLYDPKTLTCGHTYCIKCLSKETLRTCKVCQSKIKSSNVANLKANVLVVACVDRWWAGEVEGVKLRTQGNNYFKEKQLERAVELYTEAVDCAPNDHLLLSNRSHVLHTLGRAEEALSDAEAAIRCRPEWAKGYFRRAMALISLGRFEDALVSLLQCAVLEEPDSLRSIKDEITKVLHRLLVKLTNRRRVSLEGRGNCLNGYKRLSPALSDPSIPPESDSEDSEDSEDGRRNPPSGIAARPVEEEMQLRKLMDKYRHEMERSRKSSTGYVRHIDMSNVEKNDFECTLCYRFLYQPVTTPCGHSFCRTCLDRCLDHSTNCPLCKTSIKVCLSERSPTVTEFVHHAMEVVMPNECLDRRRQHDDELDELAAAGKDPHHEIPVFIATLAIPTITCPLHVFEPRYRLMIRRCMESGTREFGMCMPMETAENGYADYGTILEIRDVEYTPDGRAIVNTVGSRRFKIVSKSARDGYNTAAVEFLEDNAIPTAKLGESRQLHDTVHTLASRWFESIEPMTKRRILNHYGNMPSVEGEYWTLSNGPAWMWWIVAILPLDPRIQLSILRETSLLRRLEVLHRILRCVMAQQRSRQNGAAPQ